MEGNSDHSNERRPAAEVISDARAACEATVLLIVISRVLLSQSAELLTYEPKGHIKQKLDRPASPPRTCEPHTL
ncbi:MAG TPA: hypothetical protein VJQ45_03795 [Ktedonobacterales bacterium]|nr:hypothetical protein [Ktedonobacterales bacterium]